LGSLLHACLRNGPERSVECRDILISIVVHRVGNEAAWWKDAGIDPAKAARKLWKDSRSVTDGIPSANSDDHGHSGNVLTPSS